MLAFCVHRKPAAAQPVRTVLPLPPVVLDVGNITATVLLAAGLAALGLGARFQALRGARANPLLLGLTAWAVAAGTALGLVLVVG